MDERNRLLAAVAAESRVEVRAIRSQLGRIEDLRLDSFAIENRLEDARAAYLVDGRVGGVDAEILGENTLGFAGERVPIDWFALGRERCRREEQRREESETEFH